MLASLFPFCGVSWLWLFRHYYLSCNLLLLASPKAILINFGLEAGISVSPIIFPAWGRLRGILSVTMILHMHYECPAVIFKCLRCRSDRIRSSHVTGLFSKVLGNHWTMKNSNLCAAGSMHQGNKRFSDIPRGRQCAFMSMRSEFADRTRRRSDSSQRRSTSMIHCYFTVSALHWLLLLPWM